MSEHILRGKTVNLKYGVTKEDNKLRFTFCGLDAIPEESKDNQYLFNQILERSELILKFTKPETIEYAQREVFTLETCISVYLIDYIKSTNDLSHVTPEMLETIYTSEEINKEFTNIVDTVIHAKDKDSFFQNENTALSLIHDAFRINELSYEKKLQQNIENQPFKIHTTQDEDYIEDDMLDRLEASIASKNSNVVEDNDTNTYTITDDENTKNFNDKSKNEIDDSNASVPSIKSFTLDEDNYLDYDTESKVDDDD